MSCITTKPNVSLPMRLTLHADYSLRVLMFAGLKGSELSTITEIAEHFEISRSHLMKVVHDLGRLGYIETVQGKNGGFRLMRKPSQINVGTVVRDTEEELAVIGCLQQKGFCRIEDACVLRRALQEATKAFLAVLDKYTLEDLLRPARSLAKLLAIDWAPQALSAPG
jgi:Rrf2 family transcriptional regulator, nitric oxide-sensitive transcriptional repressor